MFSTTPVGLALITTGILYFVVFGRFVLPTSKNDGSDGELAKLVGIKILPGKKYKLDNKVVVVTSSQASILALYVDSGISQVKQILQQLELY